MNIDFTPKKRERVSLTFTLGDEHIFEFTAPKKAHMLAGALGEDSSEASLVSGPFQWLRQGLSEEDWELIVERLMDDDDDLDIDFLSSTIQRLIAETSTKKRPTK